MFKIGLTGGIGSGKSTVSKILKSLSITVIDADIVAREVLTLYPQILKKVKIELIEIGKKEEIGKTIDFWYKVRIDDKIGWLFGGLTLG